MPRTVFDQLNQAREAAGEALLANPRNTTSGTLKMQDSSVVAQRFLGLLLILADDRRKRSADTRGSHSSAGSLGVSGITYLSEM